MTYRTSRALVLGALVLVACSSSGDRDRDAAPVPVDAAPEPAVHAFVAHRDARTDLPSFAWLSKNEGAPFSTAHEAALTTLKSVSGTFGLSPAALASVEMASVDDHGRGPIVARFKQRERGIEVFRGGLAIGMTRTFDPVSASGFLAPSLAGADRPFVRTARDAVTDAHVALTAITGRSSSASFAHLVVSGDYESFSASGVALSAPARVKKVLYPQAAGVVPAYYVELQIARGPAYAFVVSAADGHVLFTNNLVRNDAFNYRVYADPATKIPLDGPQGNAFAPYPGGKPDGIPPAWGATQLIPIQNYPFSKNDPWLAATATSLSGNNVKAYPDLVSPDGLAGDAVPVTTGANAFDYTYDTTVSPGATATNKSASATHLFYVTNFLHDWYYDLGFDESAGNHQVDNFGRGGVGNDPLHAEAQDFGGRNNADATVPADGASPRLQMYIFSGPSIAHVKVLTPAPIAGTKDVGLAGFGKDAFDVSGTVVVGTDDQGVDPLDG